MSGERARRPAAKRGSVLADSADKGREEGRQREAVIVLTESVWILWIWQKTEVVSTRGSGWDAEGSMLYFPPLLLLSIRFLHIGIDQT